MSSIADLLLWLIFTKNDFNQGIFVTCAAFSFKCCVEGVQNIRAKIEFFSHDSVSLFRTNSVPIGGLLQHSLRGESSAHELVCGNVASAVLNNSIVFGERSIKFFKALRWRLISLIAPGGEVSTTYWMGVENRILPLRFAITQENTIRVAHQEEVRS